MMPRYSLRSMMLKRSLLTVLLALGVVDEQARQVEQARQTSRRC